VKVSMGESRAVQARQEVGVQARQESRAVQARQTVGVQARQMAAQQVAGVRARQVPRLQVWPVAGSKVQRRVPDGAVWAAVAVVPAVPAGPLPGATESGERRAAEEVGPGAPLRREAAERVLLIGRLVSPRQSQPGWAEWARVRPVPGDPEG
jgi:hypothetical protein